MATTRSRKSMNSHDDGLAELDAFCRFCASALTTEHGRPFEIHPFQRTILRDYFTGARETTVLLPKKNGKSSLVAALALWHLLSMPFAEALIVAAARDQAGIVMRQVTGFVRRSSQLRARLKIVQREVRNDELDGRLRVLASDVDTVDGQLPTFVAVDELHRHKRAELYGILRDGLGPRDGQLVAISTAGDDEMSPLGQLRNAAYELGVERDGPHRHVRSGGFAFHEWALDPEDDVDDLDLVKTVNPLVPLEELRVRHESPTMTEWQWKRFACGIWTRGEFGAFEPAVWHAGRRNPLEVPEGAFGPVVGVDLGLKWDSTAIVPVFLHGGAWLDGRTLDPPRRQWVRDDAPTVAYVEKPVVLIPPRDGTSLAIETIFAACADIAARWPRPTFVLDPQAGGEQLAQRLAYELESTVTVATMSQTNAPMARAAQRLAEMLTGGRLLHTGDETLTAHVLACGVRQVGEGWRLVKQQGSSASIDAAVALAMALSTAIDNYTPPDPPSVPPGGYRTVSFS